MWAHDGAQVVDRDLIGVDGSRQHGAIVSRDYRQFLRYVYRHFQYARGMRNCRRDDIREYRDDHCHPDAMQSLARNGFAVIPKAFSPDIVGRLRNELERTLERGQLCPVERNAQDPHAPATLDDHEMAGGEKVIAQLANIAYVKDPLITCPASATMALSDLIANIAGNYYGCLPVITAVHVMKSFVNDLPEMGFNWFHCDLQSIRFIKFFIYLDDVDANGGPFTIVPASAAKKPFAWQLTNRWTTDDIIDYYGEDAIQPVVAKAGDLIVADTTRIHCGRKPISKPRRAIMINTGVHRIKSFANNALNFPADELQRLSQQQRAMAALFTPVGANDNTDLPGDTDAIIDDQPANDAYSLAIERPDTAAS